MKGKGHKVSSYREKVQVGTTEVGTPTKSYPKGSAKGKRNNMTPPAIIDK